MVVWEGASFHSIEIHDCELQVNHNGATRFLRKDERHSRAGTNRGSSGPKVTRHGRDNESVCIEEAFFGGASARNNVVIMRTRSTTSEDCH